MIFDLVGRNILSKGSKSQFVRLRAQVQRWEVQFPDMLSSFGCKLSWNNPSQEWHFGGKLVYELFTDTSFFIEVAHGVHSSSPLTYKGSAQHNQMRHMRQHISSRNTWLRRSRLSSSDFNQRLLNQALDLYLFKQRGKCRTMRTYGDNELAPYKINSGGANLELLLRPVAATAPAWCCNAWSRRRAGDP